MPRADAIEVEGVVVEALPNKTYRVELANGHRVVAFLPGRARLQFVRFVIGNKVKLAMSPYDLSQGRIMVETQTI
jgi:translation initiation factor IF-1